MDNKFALGIDIGGTNTAYGIVNQDSTILFENSCKTKDFNDPKDLVDFIYSDLAENGFENKILGISVGAPNGNHFTGNIEFAPNLAWKGIVPISAMFMNIFKVQCSLTNDANAAAIGEMLFGKARGMKDFVTITLGTGLGSGVIANGKLVYGHDGLAGEYGHIRVIPNGRLCGCGRKGCLETYASSTGVVRSITELDSDHKAQSKLLNIENPTSQDVSELAEEGDLFAIEILDFTANILGSALADFICFSSPEAYILFGGCAKSGEVFAQRVKEAMEENVLKIYENKVKILISDLQDRNAAVLGTAAHVYHQDKNQL